MPIQEILHFAFLFLDSERSRAMVKLLITPGKMQKIDLHCAQFGAIIQVSELLVDFFYQHLARAGGFSESGLCTFYDFREFS